MKKKKKSYYAKKKKGNLILGICDWSQFKARKHECWCRTSGIDIFYILKTRYEKASFLTI